MRSSPEVPKKKITVSGIKNAFKLYSYIKPYRVTYFIGLFFLFGSSLTNLAFPKLLGDLVNSGNEGQIAEKGTHEELMQIPDGKYRGLSNLQFIS